MRRADRARGGKISQAAVARVIADYLRFEGQLRHVNQPDHRRLKDRVNRALSGQALTSSTLECFMRAFSITDEDARQLWSSFTGVQPSQIDKAIEPPPLAADVDPSTAKFETVALYELHRLGPDGLPIEHLTTQRIRAIAGLVDSYPLRFDAKAVTIDVTNGDASDVFRWDDGIAGVDIRLPRPLEIGETVEIKYSLAFLPPAPSDPRFRRFAFSHIEQAAITVQFNPARLPEAIFWAVWSSLASVTPVMREHVALGSDYSVTRQGAEVLQPGFAVGFCWDW